MYVLSKFDFNKNVYNGNYCSMSNNRQILNSNVDISPELSCVVFPQNLQIKGSFLASGHVTVVGDLIAQGGIKIKGTLRVEGKIFSDYPIECNNLDVDRSIICNDSITIDNDLIAAEDISAVGPIKCDNWLKARNIFSEKSISAGYIKVSKNLEASEGIMSKTSILAETIKIDENSCILAGVDSTDIQEYTITCKNFFGGKVKLGTLINSSPEKLIEYKGYKYKLVE